MSLKQEQVQAAQEFVSLTLDALKTERGVHAETAIAATARMAGTFLFRSFGFPMDDLKPGQVVLSDAANEQGPQLIQIMIAVLDEVGITFDRAQLGNAPGPENQPLRSFAETQKLLEPLYSIIKDRHRLTAKEAAEAGAAATAILVQQCAQVLDPNIAVGIATYGFVEGSKIAPAPVARSF